jgi:hypothetical protein
MGNPPLATGDRPLAEGHVMPSVDVKLAEGDYTEKQRHEMAARLQPAILHPARSATLGWAPTTSALASASRDPCRRTTRSSSSRSCGADWMSISPKISTTGGAPGRMTTRGSAGSPRALG